jgi:hypothetical protein
MVHGALKIVRTEENLDRVRVTSQCSPRRYARQQSHILGGTGKNLGRDVSCLQTPTVQKFVRCDNVSRVEFCNATLDVLSKDAGVWNSALVRDKRTVTHRILLIKNMRYRAPRVLENCTNSRCVHLKWQSGVRWEHSGLWMRFYARGKGENITVTAETNSNCNSSAATLKVLQQP